MYEQGRVLNHFKVLIKKGDFENDVTVTKLLRISTNGIPRAVPMSLGGRACHNS